MKKRGVLFTVLFLLGCWTGLLVQLYEKGKNSKALIYAEIPDETIRFLDSISNQLDFLIRYDPKIQLKDWKNRNNIGEDERTGLAKIEDRYFIVYFDKNNNKELEKAKKIMEWANKGIPELTDLMGKYPYPADVNDRKLPIYIASSEKKYEELAYIINGSPFKMIPSAGLYFSVYSRMGNMTLGILLNSIVWSSDKYAQEVLWHEMNHYVYFTLLHYDKIVRPYIWVYEGLARYFSREELKITQQQIELCMQYTLFNSFPDFLANYWGGESVYRFIENEYGIRYVKSFIHHTYSNTIDNATSASFNKGLNRIEEEWKAWLNNKDLQ